MPVRSDIIYVYDGSFEGLLTAVFESFERRELPVAIVSESELVPCLFCSRIIVTDPQKADRVRCGIKNTAGSRAWDMVRLGYLTCAEDRGAVINDFVHMAMHYGAGVTKMIADDTVNRLMRAVRALTQESHKFKQFIRFSVNDNVMSAVIEPQNSVLPLLTAHFCDRYPNETFMIYDKTHHMTFVWHNRQKMTVPLDDFEPPQAGEDERYFRALWKHFYDTVAIKERLNPRCRMNFMPKKYWAMLPEMDESNTPDAVRGMRRIEKNSTCESA